MIKKIILGSFFLFSLQTLAQEGTASPYSFHGVGDVKFRGNVDNRSMGGIGILNDSIHINLQNPAALSSIRFTTFTVASTFTPSRILSGDEKQKAQRTTLDYLAMVFPAGKFSMSLGVLPYSSVGYKIIKKTDEEAYKYDGLGGLNKAVAAFSYQISPKLSFGAGLDYAFGKIERNVAYFQSDTQYGINENNVSRIGGVVFNFGAIYKTKIRKLDFLTSATFATRSNLVTDNTRVIGRATLVNGTVVVFDEEEVNVQNTRLKLPSKFSFGSGIGAEKKWFVGFESSFLSKGDLDIDKNDDAVYEAATKFAFGGYYVPKYNSFSSYFDRVTYRAGLRYENTGLVVKNIPIVDKAVTLGLGLPLGGVFSNVNLGFELGRKGTKSAGLVQENYMNFSVGISFSDRWFMKRKYD
jgi:long-subunit fatty acid transport protein